MSGLVNQVTSFVGSDSCSNAAQGAGDAAKIAGMIFGMIAEWVKANKEIPSEISQLRLLASTIKSSTEHLTNATDGQRDLLEAIASQLRSAKALLDEFAVKSKQKWHFNPKKIINRLRAITEPLENYFKLLQKSLQVSGPIQANVSKIITDKDAAHFWSIAFGENITTVDYAVFCGAIQHTTGKTSSHFNEGHIPKKMAVFRFEKAIAKFGGWDSTLKMFDFTNPWNDENIDSSKQSMPTSQSPASNQQATPTTSAKKPAIALKYFYIVSETGLVLGVFNDISNPGAAIVAGLPRLSPFQQWKFDGLGCIRNRATGLVIDVDNHVAPGQNLVQWPAHGGASQRWNIGSDGVIRSWENKDFCFDVDMKGTTQVKPVIIWYSKDEIPRRLNQSFRLCNYIPMAPPSSSPSAPPPPPPQSFGTPPPY